MQQNTRVECVNRAERIRNRALHVEARAGRYDNYWKLVRLSMEVPSIRFEA